MDTNALCHHGILGMKWGKRNGPPYPLNYTDLSEAERSQAKSKAIREGNIKEAMANKSHFDDNELRQLIGRYDLNTKLSQISNKDVKTGGDKVDSAIKALERTAKLAEGGTRVYNAFAKIANAFGEKMPVVGEKTTVNVADRKTRAQLEKMVKNANKYTADQMKDINSALQTLKSAEDVYRADKTSFSNADDFMRMAVNPGNYTDKELADAWKRYAVIKSMVTAEDNIMY